MKRRFMTNYRKPSFMGGILTRKFLAWLFFVFFIIIQIFSTIQVSTSGAKLAELEDKQRQLTLMNKTLSEELVKSSSYSFLEKKGEETGFIGPQEMLYIGEEVTVAKLP